VPSYQFIEIGTSDFDTELEKNKETTDHSISIEPIKYYLDNLPDVQNRLKLNLAISPNNDFGTGDIYFIPPENISMLGLPFWYRGSNSLDGFHKFHNDSLKPFVVKEKIQKVPLFYIFEKYLVKNLELLKIDAEGMDCDILINFSVWLKKNNRYPKKIIFEVEITPEEKINQTLQIYNALGYKIMSKSANVILTYL